MITGLYFLANTVWGYLYYSIVKRQKKIALKNQSKENGQESNAVTNGHANINIADIDEMGTECTI